MSTKSTRSTKSLDENEETKKKCVLAPAIYKIFYVAEKLLQETTKAFSLERFFHPGRNAQALFLIHAGREIMEIMEFRESHRSWLINSSICSNGRIYVATPMDATFLALHHIRKYCATKALEIETIHDETDTSVSRLLKNFVTTDMLSCIADVKIVLDERPFYKYNESKALAWLALKAKNLAAALRQADIYCGNGCVSQYYKSFTLCSEDVVQDYLRYACDIVGGYLALDLHEQLKHYLNLPIDTKVVETKEDERKKRKSLTTLISVKNKKLKTDENGEAVEEAVDVDIEIARNTSFLDESINEVDVGPSTVAAKPTPLKERALSAKEKALAKSAKGTKSIASFFKK